MSELVSLAAVGGGGGEAGRMAPRLLNDDGEVTRLPPLRRDFRRSSGAVEHSVVPTGCTITKKPHSA
jgi:hypothetical protein